jgi:hypothetical protein
MKTKITAALIAMMLTPSLALAMGCSSDHKEITASSCKDGATWDAAKGECILTPST